MALPEDRVLRILADVASQGQGAQAAFKQLYVAYSREVYAFAWNKLRRAEEAEEVLVETMHEVWRSAHRFRAESSFTTWLLGIARHKILDRWRAADPPFQDIDDVSEVLADESAGAFEQIAEADRAAGVGRCMQRLSAEQRECLHLLYFQDMTVRDVARIQAVPEGTVKTRLFSARQRVKDCLRAMLHSEGIRGAA